MKRHYSIIGLIVAMVLFWCIPAMADGNYHMQSVDFGTYDEQGVWQWGPSFNPQGATLWECFDETDDPDDPDQWGDPSYQTMQPDRPFCGGNFTDCCLVRGQINFAPEWVSNAVSPHRQFQEDCFKWEENEPTMVPNCWWNYDEFDDDGDGDHDDFVFMCEETRPEGYENTALWCESEPYTADWDDGTGQHYISYDICEQSCIAKRDDSPVGFELPYCSDVPWLSEKCVGTGVMFDAREYHESHPDANRMRQRGGWKLISEFYLFSDNDTPPYDIMFHNITTGTKLLSSEYDCFNFLGQGDICENSFWLGHNWNVEGDWEVSANGQFVGTFTPDMDIPKIPFVEIKNMKFAKDGNIVVSLLVPENTLEDTQIRVRIFDSGSNFLYQQKINPPYVTVQKNGTVKDGVKATIPAVWAGHNARIEFRYQGSRTVLWFTLPQ